MFAGVSKYFERVGIALSVLLNVLLGGSSNQTFSARNYYWHMQKKPNIVFIIDYVFFWDPNHCLMSWVYWKTGKDIRDKTLYKKMKKEKLKEYYELQE